MIHPIYPMAALTSVVALIAFGALLRQMSPDDPRRPWIFALVMVGLAMSPAAYFALRRPLLIGPLEPILKQPKWDAEGWSIIS